MGINYIESVVSSTGPFTFTRTLPLGKILATVRSVNGNTIDLQFDGNKSATVRGTSNAAGGTQPHWFFEYDNLISGSQVVNVEISNDQGNPCVVDLYSITGQISSIDFYSSLPQSSPSNGGIIFVSSSSNISAVKPNQTVSLVEDFNQDIKSQEIHYAAHLNGATTLDSNSNTQNSNVSYGVFVVNLTDSSKATGGTVTDTTVNGVDYRIHTFINNGTFEVLENNLPCEYLIVAGGGGGAQAGGGAGGLLTNLGSSKLELSAQTWSISVGNGGAGSQVNGSNGGDSSAFNLTATGGGGGGGGNQKTGNYIDGLDGGSGGGGASYYGQGLPGSGVAGQGYAGSESLAQGPPYMHGGGGGASETGGVTGSTTGGKGGDGLSSDITGTASYYAGGGGGGGNGGNTNNTGTGGSSGLGGGAAGHSNTPGLDGRGGGGAGAENEVGGTSGGSGIVIIRYKLLTTFEATATLETNLSLLGIPSDTNPVYIEPGYYATGYVEGGPVGQTREASASLNTSATTANTASRIRVTNADFVGTTDTASSSTRIRNAVTKMTVTATADINYEILVKASAEFVSISSTATQAEYIADIDSQLEYQSNLDSQAAKFSGITQTLTSEALFSTDATRLRSTHAQLTSNFASSISFIKEFSADFDAASSVTARAISYQLRDMSPRPLNYTNTQNTSFTTNGYRTDALVLESRNNEYADARTDILTSGIEPAAGEDFVIETWFQVLETGTGTLDTDILNASFAKIYLAGNSSFDINYVYNDADSGDREKYITSQYIFADNRSNWHHVAITRTNGVITAWHNNQELATRTYNGTMLYPYSTRIRHFTYSTSKHTKFKVASVVYKKNTSERTLYNQFPKNDDNTVFLHDFNGNLIDDTRLTLDTSANIASTSNITTQAGGIFKNSAGVGANTSVYANASAVKSTSAEFVTETSINADLSVTRNAVSTLNTEVEFIVNLTGATLGKASVSANASMQATTRVTRELTSTPSVSTGLDADADRLADADSSLDTQFDTSTLGLRQKQLASKLETSTETLTTAQRRTDTLAVFATEVGTDFTAGRLLDITLDAASSTLSFAASLTRFAYLDTHRYTVPAESLRYRVPSESRTHTVQPENRTHRV